jgi:putative flippase GtrA
MFSQKIPEIYASKMPSTFFSRYPGLAAPLAWLFSLTYWTASVLVALMIVGWTFIKPLLKLPPPLADRLHALLVISMLGVVLNAAICGALSEPAARYQARVAAVPLFLLLVVVVSYAWGQLRLSAGIQSEQELSFRMCIELLPRPLRFLAVGGIGLTVDLIILTAVMSVWPHPLQARIVSLSFATAVTWRLNRAITFDKSGRHQSEEALRYAIVTAISQGTSYAIFAALVLTILSRAPQLALLPGAVAGAVVAYNLHKLFAFKPRNACRTS